MAVSAKKTSKVAPAEQEAKKPARRACCRKSTDTTETKSSTPSKSASAKASASKSAVVKTSANKAAVTNSSTDGKHTAAKASVSKASAAKTDASKTAVSTASAVKTSSKTDASKVAKGGSAKSSAAKQETMVSASADTLNTTASAKKSATKTASKAVAKEASTKSVTAKAASAKAVAKADGTKSVTAKAASAKAVAKTTAAKTTAAKATDSKATTVAKSGSASADKGDGSKPKIKGTMVGAEKINRKMLAPVDSKREIVRKAEPSDGVEPEFADITLLNKKERFEVMRLLEEQNPNPKSELNFNNPFELLCAVVLSAQATDASVNKATPALFEAAPDAKSMAALGAEGIAPFIQSIGLWKNKAKFLANLAKTLDEKYKGKVPDNMEELVALPGVGSKTAKVVLNVAFGKPYLAVDTHVFRVSTRLGLCLGHCPGDVENKIPPLIDERFLKEAHHYLLLHGRYNCTARRFEDHCSKCVVAKYCKHNY